MAPIHVRFSRSGLPMNRQQPVAASRESAANLDPAHAALSQNAATGYEISRLVWPPKGGLQSRLLHRICSGIALVACAARTLAGVVINEIMYHPPDDRDDLQFVELFNSGNQHVELAGWKLDKGATFVFPSGTGLGPGTFAVVCANAKAFAAHFGKVPIAGEFKGRLKHGGERLDLVNSRGEIVESVKFDDHNPWPAGPDGHSPSLERICPAAPVSDPHNWSASTLPPREIAAGTPGKPNDSYSALPLPVITNVQHTDFVPGRPTTIQMELADPAGTANAMLIWEVHTLGKPVQRGEAAMTRTEGDAKRGTYRADIPTLPPDKLVRYRIRAQSTSGASRECPNANEPRPAFSFTTISTTLDARIPALYVWTFGSREPAGSNLRNGGGRNQASSASSRGVSAVIAIQPGTKTAEVFDFVKVRPRPSGFKINFANDRPFMEMDNVNVIYESGRSALSEPLSFELFRRAGVPSPLATHARVWVDGRPMGYQLVMEQPNKAFLKRNGRSPGGNLYKLLWYEDGPVGQHEKKTNARTGHADLLTSLEGLKTRSASAQWEFIQKDFNVEVFVNYFAVNMCVQNWDGFFNNYFVYRDIKPGSKWEIYPWDQDKTWGEFDGASSRYDWYDMPLTMGMNGDQPPRLSGLLRFQGGGPFGGTSWWRPPGWFSGPLLANPEFRKKFLTRLDEICKTVFTPAKMEPVISALENRLTPEIRYRASLTRQDPEEAMKNFQNKLESFRQQAQHRRQFILQALAKEK